MSSWRRKVDSWLCSPPSYRLLLVSSLAALIVCTTKYGVALFPVWPGQVDLAQNWLQPTNVSDPDNYILASPLNFVVPGMLGFSSEFSWVVFSLTVTVVALLAPFLVGGKRVTSPTRLFVFIVLVGGPVPAVLLQWVGSYDVWFVIFASVATLSLSRSVVVLAWLILGFHHFSLAIISWLLLLIVQVRLNGLSRHRATEVVSMALGFGLAQLLYAYWGVSPNRIETFLEIGPSTTISLFLWNWPLVVFSALGVVWLLVLAPEIFRLRGSRTFIAVALCSTVVLGAVTLDESRIAALAVFPVTLWLAKHWASVLPHGTQVKIVWRYLPIAVILPIVLIWKGQVFATGFTWMLEPLSRLLA